MDDAPPARCANLMFMCFENAKGDFQHPYPFFLASDEFLTPIFTRLCGVAPADKASYST